MLAVSAFAADGLEQATLVISGGDDLYFSQVATSPPSLLYGTSSSYLGDESNAGVIRDFASKTKLMIAEGREVNEDLIRADGSPAWGQPGLADETFFLPKHVPHFADSYSAWRGNPLKYTQYGSLVEVETRGTIQITQPDGAVSVWGFTNWNQETQQQSIRFNNRGIFVVDGPSKGGQHQYFNTGITPAFQAITPGYYYPESIQVESDDPGEHIGPTPTGFRVRWNQPLSATTNPILKLDTYQTETRVRITGETVQASAYASPFSPPTSAAEDAADDAGGGAVGGGGAGSSPSSDQYQVTFTLTEAEGQGLIPGAFFGTAAIRPFGVLGEVVFAGTDISVTDGNEGVTNPLSSYEGSYRLRFKQSNGKYAPSYRFDNQNVGQQNSLAAPETPGPLGSIQVEGFYNTRQGTVTLLFRIDGYAAKPGRVELQNVRYAVYEASNEAKFQSKVYVEPGLDLNAAVTVEMLTPGAALYVNNPITAAGGTQEALLNSPVAEGAIALRASEIYLNADIQAELRVDIGNTTERAQATGAATRDGTGATLAIYRDPTAVLNVQGGQLSAMQPVQGFEGSGYSVGSKPKVVVSSPREARAEISAGRLIGGIYNISTIAAGAGYTQFKGWSPLNLSPPELAGWDENNDGTIDYPAVKATAEANYVDGKISEIKVTNYGFGYLAPPTITIPAPAQPASLQFTPIQAVLSPQFGGVLTSLSVDFQGYNYIEQEEGFFDPDEQEPPENAPPAAVTLTAYANPGASGQLDQFVVYPLVGPGRFIARAKLPDGGLRGGVTLTAIDTDNNGVADSTVVSGSYTWRATVDTNGELQPFYTIEVSSPPPLDPRDVNRPAVDAVVGASGRIERYEFAKNNNGEQLKGSGYGVVPGYFVVPPSVPQEPSSLVVVLGAAKEEEVGGVAAIRPKSPNLVFDVAKDLGSFLDTDTGRPSDRQALADISIAFGAETITVEENDDGSIDGQWGGISPEVFERRGFEKGEDALYETRIERDLVLQALEGPAWVDKLTINPSDLSDESVFFDGKLVALRDIRLSTLKDRLGVANNSKIEEIEKNFGTPYRLIVRSDFTLTHIAANGVRTTLPANTIPNEFQSIGKAYLATGAGYRSGEKPIVQVQRSSADKEPAVFSTELDDEGRIFKFHKVAGGAGYVGGVEYKATVTPLRNPGATELVQFNSSIQSDHFDVRVADDIRDDRRVKGELYISPLTTLRRGVDGASLSTPATSTYIEADTADIFVAGQVNATTQSYVLQSPIYRQLDGPFQFSTINRETGAQSGRLVGETLTLAFGAETSELSRTGSIITHIVDIDTNLSVAEAGANNSNSQVPGSLRVTAGANRTDGTFPVSISIRESTALAVDSNIRSSGQVTIVTGGDLEVNAAIETKGDLTLEGGSEGSRVTLSGPLKSTAGSISVQGGSVLLDADVEAGGKATEGNIVLRATAGDVIVSGTVRASRGGEIRIDQDDPVFSSASGSYQAVKTTTGTDGKAVTTEVLNLSITDRETTTAVLTVPETQGNYSRINVTLDIAHGYTGDLVGTLVAPSGERYTLFNRRGWYFANFDDVTFDNVASKQIRSSYPPFSGAYQPEEAIGRPLDHTGVWRLEVFDAQTGYGGTLNRFGLEFVGGETNVNVTAGSVSGAGLLAASRVEIAAEGNIGAVGAGTDGLLRTNARVIEARSAYGDVGVREVAAAEFYVSAFGTAALQAGGTDIVDRYGEVTAALRADVRNATKVAVEAPRGSIKATVYGNEAVELAGFGRESSPRAAGDVSINVIEADAVITDSPVAGSARVTVDRVVTEAQLPAGYELIGDVEGYAAGVIRGTGRLGGFTVGQQLLLVGAEQKNSDPVSLVTNQLQIPLVVAGNTVRRDGRNVHSGWYSATYPEPSEIWEPILAGEFSGRRELVWGYRPSLAEPISKISVWSLDLTSTWDGSEDIYEVGEDGFQEVERRYQTDIDEDGDDHAEDDDIIAPNQLDQPIIIVAGDPVQVAGEDVDKNEYSQNWQPILAGEFSGRRELVWGYRQDPRKPISQLSVWSLDLTSAWDGSENIYEVADGGFQEVERRYNTDIDKNGSVGNELREANGRVRLDVSQAGQPIADGHAVTAFGQDVFENGDWRAVAADEYAGSNVLAWQHKQQPGRFLLWICGDQWQRREALVVPQPGSVEHGAVEVSLSLDLNNDGVVGVLDDEGVRGDAAAIAADGRIFIGGKPLVKNEQTISTETYQGWRILGTAAEPDGTGSVLWGHVSGRVSLWEIDGNSVWTRDGNVPSPSDAVAFAAFELKYGVNLANAGFWSLMPAKALLEKPASSRVSYAPEKYAGIYIVTSTGGMATNWEMVRAEAFNTGGEFADRTRVLDLSTGKNLQIERLVGQLGSDENAVVSRVVEVGATTTSVATSPGHSLTYVVTEAGGDNQTSGSLGRVLALLNANEGRLENVPAIGFASRVGTILPAQELPQITKSIVVDGDKRWLPVNGAGRLVDVTWQEVEGATGLGYVAQTADSSVPVESLRALSKVALAGDRVISDRAGNPLSLFGDYEIHGIVFSGVVGGQFEGREESQVSELRNIEIGGFRDGAAVLIEQSADIVIDGVVLGAGGLTNQQGNRYGLRVAGSQRVTLNNSQVTANTTGVRIQDGDSGSSGNQFETSAVVSDGVVIAATTVNNNSGVGVDVVTNGRVAIGTMPIGETINVPLLRGQTVIDLTGVISDPATFFSQLYLGMAVAGSGVAAGTTVAGFNPVTQRLTLSLPVEASSPRDQVDPQLRAKTSLIFGSLDASEHRNTISGNSHGIVLSGGAHSIRNTTVSDNAADGILVTSVSDVLSNESHRIGASGALSGGYQNRIEGNGGFGLLLASGVIGRVSIKENVFENPDVTAVDNRLGNIGRRSSVLGSIRDEVFAGLNNKYQPAVSGFDNELNVHFGDSDISRLLPPPPPVLSPIAVGSGQDGQLLALTGTAVANAAIEIFIDDVRTATTRANEAGNWGLTLPTVLAAGSRRIEATATNNSGLTSGRSEPVIVEILQDTTPPGAVTIATTEITSNLPVITGQAEPGTRVELQLNGATFGGNTAANGTWMVDTSVAPIGGLLGTLINGQSYTLVAVAIDASGNQSSPVEKNLRVNVPLPAPQPPRRPSAGF